MSRTAILIYSIACLSISLQPASANSAQPSAQELLAGFWNAGSSAFNGQNIDVEARVLSFGECTDIAYAVIRDQPGHGPGMDPPSEKARTWREITIELKPKNPSQARCLDYRILDFSIPADMPGHADIALFKTRSDFDNKSKYYDWGVWGNTK
jgi:hypothetical protein